jgi:NhaP-type Na+/H+ or K+/H+ antiporter
MRPLTEDFLPAPELYYVLAGALLLFMAATSSLVDRLPLTSGVAYLVVGIVIGPQGWRFLGLDPLAHASLIERVAEVALLFSLFSAGLKLRVALRDARWHAPVRLASVGMVLTVAGIAAVAAPMLGLPWPLALVVAAILAPTDPVLASDVQVTHPDDRDRVRLTLTGEAGLNDGTAFPFLLLGLGLQGSHDLAAFGWRWVTFDVLWASAVGLATGWWLGRGVARFVVYLRREHQQAHGLDDFVALGLIAATYGTAVVLHAYGFLAVFAAGLAMRRLETEAQGLDAQTSPAQSGSDARSSARHLTREVLSFNLQMERIGEVVVVIMIGALLTRDMFQITVMLFALAVFLLVRPLAVALSVLGLRLTTTQKTLIAWFGVRGAGSVFYLAFATAHGLEPSAATAVQEVVLPVVALSIVLHGISVTPVMLAYERRRGSRRVRPSLQPG